MKKHLYLILITLISLFLVSCHKDNTNNGKINIVSSFTIITDITKEIVKDKANVHNLVPTGTDPHEYEPLPNDLKAMAKANLIFYGGLNLEGGKNGWLNRLVKTAGKSEDLMYSLSEGITPLYLHEDQVDTKINPHFFIDPNSGIVIANNILKALIEVDNINKDYYTNNATIYINRLEEIINSYETNLNKIPENKRILVTSERAFQYLAKAYNITEAYIWAIDTEENGTPAQITALINFLRENPVPYLFVESNVERSPMETVSSETNIPIYNRPIYSDEIGRAGEEVDTYIKYLLYNLDVLSKGMNIYDYN